MRYRPGKWAMASTAVMALGWLVNIWIACKSGVDTALVGLPAFVGILLCGLLPMICSAAVFYGGSGSQRAADVVFATCMIAQGIGLAILAAV